MLQRSCPPPPEPALLCPKTALTLQLAYHSTGPAAARRRSGAAAPSRRPGAARPQVVGVVVHVRHTGWSPGEVANIVVSNCLSCLILAWRMLRPHSYQRWREVGGRAGGSSGHRAALPLRAAVRMLFQTFWDLGA